MEAEDLEMTEGSSFVWHPKACLKKPYKEWRNHDPFHVNHEPNSFLRPTFLIMKPRMIAKLRSVCLSDSFEFANNHTTLRMIELKKTRKVNKKAPGWSSPRQWRTCGHVREKPSVSSCGRGSGRGCAIESASCGGPATSRVRCGTCHDGLRCRGHRCRRRSRCCGAYPSTSQPWRGRRTNACWNIRQEPFPRFRRWTVP